MSSAKYLQTLNQLIKMAANSNNFMRTAAGVRPVHAEEGRVKVEFEVTEELTNPGGTLHGGCTATLIDIATTAAVIVTPKGEPGVSVDLHVTYIAPAKLGETVVLDASVIKIGNTLAYTKADLISKATNKILATGLHTKAFAAKRN